MDWRSFFKFFFTIIQLKTALVLSHMCACGGSSLILHPLKIIIIPNLKSKQEKQKLIPKQLHKHAEEPFLHRLQSVKVTLTSAWRLACCFCL